MPSEYGLPPLKAPTFEAHAHVIENVRTDLIAAEAANNNRATFFLSMTVRKRLEPPAPSSTSKRFSSLVVEPISHNLTPASRMGRHARDR
jgi:hypothetical protein